VGPDVKIAEPGRRKSKSWIGKQGNSHIWKALYMPSLSRTVHDPETGRFYEYLKKWKGNPTVALVAVQGKMSGLMFSLWKNEQMYGVKD
jgi:hypothetical protein